VVASFSPGFVSFGFNSGGAALTESAFSSGALSFASFAVIAALVPASFIFNCVGFGNFIYLLEHGVEHVLRNAVPFRLVMKGSENLSHGNRVRHTTSKGHGRMNVVKLSITYEMEPGTTYDAERTRIK
jgi:hypothetical protein